MGTAAVLVVDDERKIRDTVRLFLEQRRYAVLLAGSGQQALDVAGRLKPDLVVLDLRARGAGRYRRGGVDLDVHPGEVVLIMGRPAAARPPCC